MKRRSLDGWRWQPTKRMGYQHQRQDGQEQSGVPQGSLPPGPGRLEQLWGPAAVGEELRGVGES